MAILSSIGRGIRNSISGTAGFFRSSLQELKKVRWPTRKELSTYTLVVVITVVLIAIFFFIIDFGIAKLVQLITQ